MEETTTKQVPNPTGKGGFADNPQNRSDGGWDKTMVFSYQYKRFMNMSQSDMDAFKSIPDTDKKVVENLAYNAVLRAKESLNDVKEITDRTEGKAPQAIDVTTKGESINPFHELSADDLRKLAS